MTVSATHTDSTETVVQTVVPFPVRRATGPAVRLAADHHLLLVQVAGVVPDDAEPRQHPRHPDGAVHPRPRRAAPGDVRRPRPVARLLRGIRGDGDGRAEHPTRMGHRAGSPAGARDRLCMRGAERHRRGQAENRAVHHDARHRRDLPGLRAVGVRLEHGHERRPRAVDLDAADEGVGDPDPVLLRDRDHARDLVGGRTHAARRAVAVRRQVARRGPVVRDQLRPDPVRLVRRRRARSRRSRPWCSSATRARCRRCRSPRSSCRRMRPSSSAPPRSGPGGSIRSAR